MKASAVFQNYVSSATPQWVYDAVRTPRREGYIHDSRTVPITFTFISLQLMPFSTVKLKVWGHCCNSLETLNGLETAVEACRILK